MLCGHLETHIIVASSDTTMYFHIFIVVFVVYYEKLCLRFCTGCSSVLYSCDLESVVVVWAGMSVALAICCLCLMRFRPTLNCDQCVAQLPDC